MLRNALNWTFQHLQHQKNKEQLLLASHGPQSTVRQALPKPLGWGQPIKPGTSLTPIISCPDLPAFAGVPNPTQYLSFSFGFRHPLREYGDAMKTFSFAKLFQFADINKKPAAALLGLHAGSEIPGPEIFTTQKDL